MEPRSSRHPRTRSSRPATEGRNGVRELEQPRGRGGTANYGPQKKKHETFERKAEI